MTIPGTSITFHSVLLFLFFFFAFVTSPGAADTPLSWNQWLDVSSTNRAKLHIRKNPEEWFSKQKTIPVIVTFAQTTISNPRPQLKTIAERTDLREKIHKLTVPLLLQLDKKEIRVRRTFTYSSGFSADVSKAGLEQLLRNKHVEKVFEDQTLQPMTNQGIGLIQGHYPRQLFDGSGISIAIFDTGIDYTHPSLGGGSFPNDKVIGGYDIGDDDPDPMDQKGHGTSCAGIAAGNPPSTPSGDYIGGVAPGAKLYALKITYTNNFGVPTDLTRSSAIISALEWCITHQYDDPENPIKIVSISFGYGRYTEICDDNSLASVGTESIQNALVAGISIFASAGNDRYTKALILPACYSGVISVGAVYDDVAGTSRLGDCTEATEADKVACYSNSAAFLDLLAPSKNASTTDLTGNDGYSSGDYAPYFNGTSAATPYAAGSAALIQSAVKSLRGTFFSPARIRTTLTTTGKLLSDPKSGISTPRVNLDHAFASFLKPGDSNGDGIIDLSDVQTFLQLVTGYARGSVTLYGDVNGDGKLGVEEAIYALKQSSSSEPLP